MNAIGSHARSSTRPRVMIDRDRWVSIRPIERTDAPGLADFYAGLSRESKRRRFLGFGNPSDRALARMFIEREGEGFVGILNHSGARDGAVVAHASVQPDGDGGAEVAVAVADELQGRGVGGLMMQVAIELARRRGLRRLSATLLPDNVPMRRLLRGAGCEVVSDVTDAGTEEIALGVNPFSVSAFRPAAALLNG